MHSPRTSLTMPTGSSDNEVSKEEFCATFADAVDSIVGGGAMVQHMERWAAR